ncbi:MAG: RNA polymerase sigma factor [Candidatus Longimicrobiales bacterium M2_2A_002]
MTDRRQTFLEMVRANRARLQKICRVYGTDPEDERDLYQQILLEAWRSLESFDGKASLDTWFYRVALNTALDRDRKRNIRTDARLDADDPVMGADVPGPEEAATRRRRVERLYAAIDRLDETDRALVLMHLDERPYAEMAEVLGITENYVGVKLHRIRKKLADWLEEER